MQDLLKGTGLTNKQFQKAKSKNPLLANILKADKTDKKGYYCKTAMWIKFVPQILYIFIKKRGTKFWGRLILLK